MSKKFEYQTQIIESHLDSFEHVNNAVYLELYEEARWDFITTGGFGLSRIKEEGIGPVILDLQVAKYEIRILTIVSTLKSKKWNLLNIPLFFSLVCIGYQSRPLENRPRLI